MFVNLKILYWVVYCFRPCDCSFIGKEIGFEFRCNLRRINNNVGQIWRYSKRTKSERSDFGILENGSVVESFGFQTFGLYTIYKPNVRILAFILG